MDDSSTSSPAPDSPQRQPDGVSPAAAVSPQSMVAPTFVIQSPVSPARRFLTWIGWLCFLFCGFLLIGQRAARREYFDVTGGVRERFHSGREEARDKIAVISVRGVILEGDGFVKRQIDHVRDDPRVKAVVLRVDSPGGTVAGSDYIYHHLKKLRADRNIPLVVSMGSIAASGGYYVSMAVGDQPKSIFAEQTTTTGSIGVIVPHYDLTGLLARFDVLDDSIASHPRKQILSPTRPMSEEDRQIIQAYVDESFDRFKEIVKSGRPLLRQANQEGALLDEKTGRDLATGEIFTAVQARQYGLVDEIGFIEDAIHRAMELAQLDEQSVRVIQYERPPSLMSLVGFAQADTSGLSLEALFELSSPRAYYLATSLPLLAASGGKERGPTGRAAD